MIIVSLRTLSKLNRRTIMTLSTYTHPPPPLKTSYKPRDPQLVLHPLLPPPISSQTSIPTLPVYPSSLTSSQPIPGFTFSRHIFPGAYPRSLEREINPPESPHAVPPISSPFGATTGANKKERLDNILQAAKVSLGIANKSRRRDVKDLREVEEPVTWIAANRFVRSDLLENKEAPLSGVDNRNAEDDEGVTLVVCHANGFNKEMWEETFRQIIHLYDSSPSPPEKSTSTLVVPDDRIRRKNRIDEIWCIDHYNHGESYLLNRGKIGNIADWSDCVSLAVGLVPPGLAS